MKRRRGMNTVIAGAAAVTLLCGCEPESSQRTQGGTLAIKQPATLTQAPAVDASLDSLNDKPSSLSSLAAQSQRDVDAILKAKAGAASSLHAKDDSSLGAEPVQRTIVWNPSPQAVKPQKAATEAPSPAVVITAAAAEPESAAVAPQSLGPDRMKSLMVDLSRELYASGAYSAAPLRELLAIAAMSMIDPQRQLDPQAIPDLTVKERELLAHLQAFFAELGSSLDSSGRDTEGAIVDAVGKLREKLVKPASLKLPTVALCTRVGGFGDYTPFEKYSFLAQNQQKAIVYLEIEDFVSELNPKGEYVTQLAQQLTIYADRDGIPVWREEWQTAVDTSRNKRQDFFTVQVVTLPKALTVGKYHLKVRVRDEKSQAEAERSISFELVADPRMAGK